LALPLTGEQERIKTAAPAPSLSATTHTAWLHTQYPCVSLFKT